MARLKIGFIPIEGGQYYKEALDEVTKAEALGLDSVWMEEHHAVTNHYWPSPLTVLAGFATRTSRVMLGTDIVVAAFHHPVRLAEDIAMLDVMSGGRITLGIAIGPSPRATARPVSSPRSTSWSPTVRSTPAAGAIPSSTPRSRPTWTA